MIVSHLVSTQFVTTSNAHQVGILVSLGAEPKIRRRPVNVALVLDRSGSMSGSPFEAARLAAERFISVLGPDDRLTLVAFNGAVDRLVDCRPAGDEAKARAFAALRQVVPEGSTNLSGGWLEGMALVAGGLVDGPNRVLLLTDGQANAGITDPRRLTGLVTDAANRGISTSCIGFGPGFNEDLLQDLAGGGRGNFWYVEEADQMAGVFTDEMDGLLSLAAQNLAIEVTAIHPAVAGVSFLQPLPVSRLEDGRWRATLPDLYASLPQSVGILLHAENVARLGETELARIQVEAQVILDDGVEHRVITLPVSANLDGQSHLDPVVESSLLRYRVAQARKEAVEEADHGNLESAARILREVVDRFCLLPPTPDLDELREDLEQEARALREDQYSSADRKYLASQSQAAFESKMEYGRRLRRKPR